LPIKVLQTQNIHDVTFFLVGGINTVIKSKVPVTVKEYGVDSYYLVGPYCPSKASLELECLPCPNITLAASIQAMRDEGIQVQHGRWLIDGHPYIILLDIMSAVSRLDAWKRDLYALTGISSGMNDFEMNDSILFGYLVAWLLNDFENRLLKEPLLKPPNGKQILSLPTLKHAEILNNYPRPIIAHFHEWLAGVGLVLLRKRNLQVATIFTTHATLLGRFLCAGDVDFYNTLHKVDVDEEAGRRGIYHRYCLERAAANLCHVFTTVSNITAYEAEHLLKRKPDGILPNGLNIQKFR
jgi:glycogen synthase